MSHLQCMACFAFIDMLVVDDDHDQCPDCGEWTSFEEISNSTERYLHQSIHGEPAPSWAFYDPHWVCRKCGEDAIDVEDPEWYECDMCGYAGMCSDIQE